MLFGQLVLHSFPYCQYLRLDQRATPSSLPHAPMDFYYNKRTDEVKRINYTKG